MAARLVFTVKSDSSQVMRLATEYLTLVGAGLVQAGANVKITVDGTEIELPDPGILEQFETDE